MPLPGPRCPRKSLLVIEGREDQAGDGGIHRTDLPARLDTRSPFGSLTSNTDHVRPQRRNAPCSLLGEPPDSPTTSKPGSALEQLTQTPRRTISWSSRRKTRVVIGRLRRRRRRPGTLHAMVVRPRTESTLESAGRGARRGPAGTASPLRRPPSWMPAPSSSTTTRITSSPASTVSRTASAAACFTAFVSSSRTTAVTSSASVPVTRRSSGPVKPTATGCASDAEHWVAISRTLRRTDLSASSCGRNAKMIVRICAMALVERRDRRAEPGGQPRRRRPLPRPPAASVQYRTTAGSRGRGDRGRCARDPRRAGRAGDPRGPSRARSRGRRVQRGRRRCRALRP